MGKQLKLSELKRVVNIDTFSKYASILADKSNTNESEIDHILDELSEKTPSRDILKQTKLGHILKELANRESLTKSIRNKSINLRQKWKDFHKNLLLAPRYDVKCDKPTTDSRLRARQSLTNAFLKLNNTNLVVFNEANELHKRLILDLEFKLFQFSDTLVNLKYFNLVKKCIRIITENSDKAKQLVENELNINTFVLNLSLIENV